MKRKLFYKIFAFTFGMMFLITVLAHVSIPREIAQHDRSN